MEKAIDKSELNKNELNADGLSSNSALKLLLQQYGVLHEELQHLFKLYLLGSSQHVISGVIDFDWLEKAIKFYVYTDFLFKESDLVKKTDVDLKNLNVSLSPIVSSRRLTKKYVKTVTTISTVLQVFAGYWAKPKMQVQVFIDNRSPQEIVRFLSINQVATKKKKTQKKISKKTATKIKKSGRTLSKAK